VINPRSGSSAPAGYRFPREVIAVAVRWYLRYGLSYRDVEELLAERGIAVDHVTIYRWVQTFTPEFIDAARPTRHATGDRWFVDETYVKVAGRWTYLYRAVDQHGQVIDVMVSKRRDSAAARAFFTRAMRIAPAPVEVTTDRAPVYPRVLDEIVPAGRHVLDARAEDRQVTARDRSGARVRAEPAPWPLRTDYRRARPRSRPALVQHARAVPLKPLSRRGRTAQQPAFDQRNSVRWADSTTVPACKSRRVKPLHIGAIDVSCLRLAKALDGLLDVLASLHPCERPATNRVRAAWRAGDRRPHRAKRRGLRGDAARLIARPSARTACPLGEVIVAHRHRRGPPEDTALCCGGRGHAVG
jgi:IS6 family transposase